MRYKIRAQNIDNLRQIQEILKDHVEIHVISERRLMISTGDIPGEIQDRVVGTGAEITQDFKYDLE
jgi:hypothetical protein